MEITIAESNLNTAKIMVIGVGGGGNNAVNQMVKNGVNSVTFMAINTDRQALDCSLVVETNRLQIGNNSTRGLGAGSDPEVGKNAAQESMHEIESAVKDMDLVFIVCGMGGGTGTGASPIVAQIAKKCGALVVGVVTTPFYFEGAKRSENAKKGIENLSKHVDSMIIIPNNKLLTLDSGISMLEAFEKANDILKQAIVGLSDLIVKPGLINLDFADVKTVLKNQGLAHMGIGRGSGADAMLDAVKEAVHSPLLETSIEGAQGLILNICGGNNLPLLEVSQASSIVQEAVGADANIIFGTSFDPALNGSVIVTIIATGLNMSTPKREVTSNQQQVTVNPSSIRVNQQQTGTVIREYPRNATPQQNTQVQEEVVVPVVNKVEKVEEIEKKPPAFIRRLFGKK